MTDELRTIGILLFDDVEELDAVGPWEVLAWWTRNHPDDGFDVVTIAPRGGVVTAAKGLRLVADHSFADGIDLDVLVHPGGQGTRPLMVDTGHLELGAYPSRRHADPRQCLYRRTRFRGSRSLGQPTRDDALGIARPPRAHRPEHRDPARRPVRGRRRRSDIGRGVVGHRPRTAPGRPTRIGRTGPRGPSCHPVRPPPADLNRCLCPAVRIAVIGGATVLD